MDDITATALKDASKQGITGAAVTPFVLKFIANATQDASVKANLSLAENNALTAAQLAVELSIAQ